MLERHQLYLYNCRFSHRCLPFLLQYWLHGFPGLFTDTSEHIRACLWKSFTKIVLSYTCISVGKWCGILSETRNNKSSDEQSVTRLVKNFDKLCRLFDSFFHCRTLITHHPSLFHSRLKTFLFCNLFHRSLPLLLQDWLRGFPRLLSIVRAHPFYFFLFLLFSCCFRAVD